MVNIKNMPNFEAFHRAFHQAWTSFFWRVNVVSLLYKVPFCMCLFNDSKHNLVNIVSVGGKDGNESFVPLILLLSTVIYWSHCWYNPQPFIAERKVCLHNFSSFTTPPSFLPMCCCCYCSNLGIKRRVPRGILVYNEY